MEWIHYLKGMSHISICNLYISHIRYNSEGGLLLKRYILSIGLMILLLVMCITPTYSSLSTSGRTVIIVDDEGDGDYVRIKDALNYANPGDTIEVYSGTYYEYGLDVVKEGITLQGIPYELGGGSDSGKPFIDGRGMDYVFLFDANNIILDGFHIENKDGTTHDILDLSQNANECTISNNDLAYTDFCFIFVKGSNNKIIYNNISNSAMDDGITLRDPCTNCIVSGNVISDVETGILCWDSNQNTITGNKIYRSREFGIDLASSNYNNIEGNEFEDNTVGVQIYYSMGTKVYNNNFINNQWQAQFFYGPIFYSFTNRWNGNYWNKSRILPYPVLGAYLFFPLIQFDWNPASEPYDI